MNRANARRGPPLCHRPRRACDRLGRWFLAGDQELKVLTRDGELVARWSTARPGWSVTTDADGRVWVGEPGQIEVFSETGRLEAVIAQRDDQLLVCNRLVVIKV